MLAAGYTKHWASPAAKAIAQPSSVGQPCPLASRSLIAAPQLLWRKISRGTANPQAWLRTANSHRRRGHQPEGSAHKTAVCTTPATQARCRHSWGRSLAPPFSPVTAKGNRTRAKNGRRSPAALLHGHSHHHGPTPQATGARHSHMPGTHKHQLSARCQRCRIRGDAKGGLCPPRCPSDHLPGRQQVSPITEQVSYTTLSCPRRKNHPQSLI